MLLRSLSNRNGRRGRGGVGQEAYPGQIQSEGGLAPPAGFGNPPLLGQPPLRQNPACPYPEIAVAVGPAVPTAAGIGSHVTLLTTPGFFCPRHMAILNVGGTGSIDDIMLTQISMGMNFRQIISGRISARLFSPEQGCCVALCMPCLCSPSVPMRIDWDDTDAVQTVQPQFIFRGPYSDACFPGAMPGQLNPQLLAAAPPGCDYLDKMLGFDFVIPASGTITVPITTPGRFCPKWMFASGDVATVQLAGVTTGMNNEILGPISLLYWDILQESGCCQPICWKCLCEPGVPMLMTFTGVPDDAVHIDVIGAFQEVC